MVIGLDSCSEGLGLISEHNILDGHFNIDFVVKFVMFIEKDRK